MFGIEQRKIEQRGREVLRLRVEAEPAQAEENRSLLYRPDGAAVVAQRIVERVRGRQRANPPAAEQIGREETSNDGPKMLRIDDAGGQTVSDVRRDRPNQTFVRIHGQREEAFILHPPVAVEPRL